MRFFLFLLAGVLFSTNVYADDFAATTTAFLDQGALPVLYTCDGKNISPEISWTNPPEKTKAFALIVTDPAAPSGTFYHWVVYNIPIKINEMPEGVDQLPKGSVSINNSFDKPGYGGPCPPKGGVHSYLYTLYALDQNIKPKPGDGSDELTPANVMVEIKNHTIKSVVLTATYSRWLK